MNTNRPTPYTQSRHFIFLTGDQSFRSYYGLGQVRTLAVLAPCHHTKHKHIPECFVFLLIILTVLL